MLQNKKVELYSGEYFYLCGIGGILSCGITHTAVTPLDLVKCNAQVDKANFPNTVQGFKNIYSGALESKGFRSGFLGLTKGWGPTLVGYSAQGLCKFGFYEYFKFKFSEPLGEENARKYRDLIYLSASASAEFIADIALCPFEAVKVRVQTNPTYASGLSDGLPKMLKNEGLSNLYAGIGPLWARQIPYTIIKFMAFERIAEAIYARLPKPKSEMNKVEQLGVVFTAGYLAGILCGAVSHPADTMVSKINKVKISGGLLTKMSTIYRGTPEMPGIGFAGLWAGFLPRVVMIGTLTGLQWFIYGNLLHSFTFILISIFFLILIQLLGTFKGACGLPTPGAEPPKK